MSDGRSLDGSSRFPLTRHSAIRGLGSDDHAVRERALHRLVEVYWKPVYKYIRIRWRRSTEDARDLTQEFFTRVIDKQFLSDFDPSKARFRTYLRTVVDRMMNNELKASARLKRGGDAQHLSLDYSAAERELQQLGSPATSIEQQFEIEWTRALFETSLEAVRERLTGDGKELQYRLFHTYDVDRIDQSLRLSYADLAEQFDLTETEVTNYLASVRRLFRRTVLDRLKELCATDEEYRDEVRRILGVTPDD